MGESNENMKNGKKFFAKLISKTAIRVVLIIILLIVFLTAAIYFITVDDGTYKEDDWSSINYGAGTYINNITVNSSDRTLNSDMTTQELWDKLIENDSTVVQYLDNPQELSRLMKAEIVTQYPDIREDPDKEIEWDKIGEDDLQGIIKFKRADEDNNISTMKYVDYDTFFSWIEQYNTNGNETAKQNALTHFTLGATTGGATANTTLNYSGQDQWTDISEAIVRAARNQPSPGAGLCQAWVRQVYEKAGLGSGGYYGSAYEAFRSTCVSTDTSNIPIGAAVYGTGSGPYNIYGHVGIYVGDTDGDGEGEVMDNVGHIKLQSLSSWIQWQVDAGNTACGGTPGWLGWGWQSGAPTRFLTEDEIEETEQRLNTSTSTVTVTTNDSNNTNSGYQVIVASWEQVDTLIQTNDPEVQATYGIRNENEEKTVSTRYSMTTTNINYREMVDKYTVPFDLLWAFLVIGEDKDFVFDLTDLIYGSDIQITIHDNLTTNTDIDDWNYTQRTKAVIDYDITAKYQRHQSSMKIYDDVHDPYGEDVEYNTVKTVITQTDTLNVALTRANVWIVDYKNDYTYSESNEPEQSHEDPKDDQEYPSTPNSTDTSATCEHIEETKKTLANIVIDNFIEAQDQGGMRREPAEGQGVLPAIPTTSDVIYDESYFVEYYKKYINISDTITNKVNTKKYIEGTPELKEKTDKDSEEPNFVTIFNKKENSKNKVYTKSVASWLFEIIETNDSTADMADLVRYLLYKATGIDYGVTEYNFSEYDASLFTGVSGLYGSNAQENVWWSLIDAGYSQIAAAAVLGNIECESGFDPAKIEGGSGIGLGLCQWSYGRRTQLEGYIANKGTNTSDLKTQIEFLLAELNPNGGANGYASYQMGGSSSSRYDGTSYRKKDWENATDIDRATTAFMALFERPSYNSSVNHLSRRKQAAKKYYNQFKDKERPTEDIRIGSSNLTGANAVKMNAMLTEALRIADDDRYYYSQGNRWGEFSYDCSSFVYRLYKEYFGITLPTTTEGNYSSKAVKVISSMSAGNLQPGDVLWRSGHVAIYLGGGQYVHASSTRSGIKVSTYSQGSFTKAYRYVQ